ncbi:MAG: hypothetical protein DRR16_31695 [Candidatus Parabeggiatoa sp. nov. 3]|nr:MAG: hypothetical protein DRR00_28230 [Gammaproteobacteria bacterium]RKZ67696.1 MAG: hypothetical protein DRQ99_05960 [Gammaproteobacteria bacterium]RKZ74976.1 MAG: hypothetical protein DRR16_31695 [Gammaproteobacteria bacterium]HEW97995.1 hypothetical protein [Beggiatoa sp.]
MPNLPKKNLPLTLMLIGTLIASFSNLVNADTLERTIFSASGGKMNAGSDTLFYSFGQPFVATTEAALQIGFLPPSQTKKKHTRRCQVDTTAKEWLCVQFQNLKPSYNIGDKIKVDILINVKVNRLKPVDLWVAMQHAGAFFFKTHSGLNAFEPKAQAHKTNLQTLEIQHTILDFELTPGLGGNYIFYAVYVDKGKNPLQEPASQRSELVIGQTKLANK